eukprot:TRINITY_DN16692_c0_g1_i1.p2 TRINITY_DN16692_c0_g1~~TRINITY_DN16692_c0_g1_i1.p2  ORF type:complete len:126 (-),score=27.01 TRINITY_DN16692_c0_g1_i1:11-388(-)
MCIRDRRRVHGDIDPAFSTFFNPKNRERWRMLICSVYLGECYVERELTFKEFAMIGEVKVLDLLREGYQSVYFERNEIYLMLFSENCVPIYLTEFEFDLVEHQLCLLYTSPSPRDGLLSRMPSSA